MLAVLNTVGFRQFGNLHSFVAPAVLVGSLHRQKKIASSRAIDFCHHGRALDDRDELTTAEPMLLP
jgi:hypothetical protein